MKEKFPVETSFSDGGKTLVLPFFIDRTREKRYTKNSYFV